MSDNGGVRPVKSISTLTSIPEFQRRLEEELNRARAQLNRYAADFDSLNAKIQHANKMRTLLLNTVEAMATKPDDKTSLQLFKERDKRKLDEKKPVRVGNVMFYLDQDYLGELEALKEIVEACNKRVFLLEKAVESLSQLRPGRERTLRVVDEDGIPLRVLVRN